MLLRVTEHDASGHVAIKHVVSGQSDLLRVSVDDVAFLLGLLDKACEDRDELIILHIEPFGKGGELTRVGKRERDDVGKHVVKGEFVEMAGRLHKELDAFGSAEFFGLLQREDVGVADDELIRHGGEDFLFGIEIVIEKAVGAFRFRGDVVDGDAVITLFGEDEQGDFEQAVLSFS